MWADFSTYKKELVKAACYEEACNLINIERVFIKAAVLKTFSIISIYEICCKMSENWSKIYQERLSIF